MTEQKSKHPTFQSLQPMRVLFLLLELAERPYAVAKGGTW